MLNIYISFFLLQVVILLIPLFIPHFTARGGELQEGPPDQPGAV